MKWEESERDSSEEEPARRHVSRRVYRGVFPVENFVYKRRRRIHAQRSDGSRPLQLYSQATTSFLFGSSWLLLIQSSRPPKVFIHSLSNCSRKGNPIQRNTISSRVCELSNQPRHSFENHFHFLDSIQCVVCCCCSSTLGAPQSSATKEGGTSH